MSKLGEPLGHPYLGGNDLIMTSSLEIKFFKHLKQLHEHSIIYVTKMFLYSFNMFPKNILKLNKIRDLIFLRVKYYFHS